MDDTFAIIKSSLKQQFTNHLNAQHPPIKFTIEDQVYRKLDMLDVLVLALSVYCKTHSQESLSEICFSPTTLPLQSDITSASQTTSIIKSTGLLMKAYGELILLQRISVKTTLSINKDIC